MSRVRVVFRATVPCAVCGYRRDVVRFSTVVVLAAHLRDDEVSLTCGPGTCPECRWPETAWAGWLPRKWTLDEQDRAKVDAVHAKKFPHRQRIAS